MSLESQLEIIPSSCKRDSHCRFKQHSYHELWLHKPLKSTSLSHLHCHTQVEWIWSLSIILSMKPKYSIILVSMNYWPLFTCPFEEPSEESFWTVCRCFDLLGFCSLKIEFHGFFLSHCSTENQVFWIQFTAAWKLRINVKKLCWSTKSPFEFKF